jgi:hypothetical protein
VSVAARQVVVHGHFYQPPREEPWLELVPREPTAAPDHDWNARITRECYAPLARARVRDAQGRLRRLCNAYAWCSFDVGPTLFRWFDDHAPEVRDAIVAGDAESRSRLGVGNAIAQPYHHIILPLASRRDKVTEVRWGIRDFQRRFGRDPEGMWLPETAVDHETLEVLAQEGIRFTVLAPHQVTHPSVHGRAGRWTSGSRELALFCYDGPLAHEIAFGDVMRDAGHWHSRIMASPLAEDGVTISSVATDGETFGHHHRHGDLALASLLDRLQHDAGAAVTNFGALLAAYPATDDVTLVERTAWSCPHGLGRWQGDCGCRMDGSTSQAWRTPLRSGLVNLANAVHATFEAEWPAGLGDPWAMRDAAGPELDGAGVLPSAAKRLLEAEQHALAMWTSCGWFFDDLARIEPRIVLRHAARAIEWLPEAQQGPLEAALLEILGTASSNDPTKGDGITIWQRDVVSAAQGTAQLAAGIAALRDVVPDALDELVLPAHTFRLDGDDIVTTHRRTGQERRWRAETVVAGVVPFRIHVRRVDRAGDAAAHFPISALPGPVRTLLRTAARPMVFDATLSDAEREHLRDGLMDSDAARLAAYDGAWQLVARDGLEDAGVVVHAAVDLFDLDLATLPDAALVTAFEKLAALPASPVRDGLATRLGLAVPDRS